VSIQVTVSFTVLLDVAHMY